MKATETTMYKFNVFVVILALCVYSDITFSYLQKRETKDKIAEVIKALKQGIHSKPNLLEDTDKQKRETITEDPANLENSNNTASLNYVHFLRETTEDPANVKKQNRTASWNNTVPLEDITEDGTNVKIRNKTASLDNKGSVEEITKDPAKVHKVNKTASGNMEKSLGETEETYEDPEKMNKASDDYEETMEEINEEDDGNPCVTMPCQNDGQCEWHIDKTPSFICTCKIGYSGNLCEHEVQQCDDSPCRGRGDCVATSKGFLCLCRSGYGGKTCDRRVYNRSSKYVDYKDEATGSLFISWDVTYIVCASVGVVGIVAVSVFIYLWRINKKRALRPINSHLRTRKAKKEGETRNINAKSNSEEHEANLVLVTEVDGEEAPGIKRSRSKGCRTSERHQSKIPSSRSSNAKSKAKISKANEGSSLANLQPREQEMQRQMSLNQRKMMSSKISDSLSLQKDGERLPGTNRSRSRGNRTSDKRPVSKGPSSRSSNTVVNASKPKANLERSLGKIRSRENEMQRQVQLHQTEEMSSTLSDSLSWREDDETRPCLNTPRSRGTSEKHPLSKHSFSRSCGSPFNENMPSKNVRSYPAANIQPREYESQRKVSLHRKEMMSSTSSDSLPPHTSYTRIPSRIHSRRNLEKDYPEY